MGALGDIEVDPEMIVKTFVLAYLPTVVYTSASFV
jgi:hypothetical protein